MAQGYRLALASVGRFSVSFPAAAGVVDGWVSWLAKLPPSVSVMIALVTAACLLLIISEIRKNSVYQRLSLEKVGANGWSFDSKNMTGVLHMQADFINSHPNETIFCKVEVLSLVLEGIANRSPKYIGADVMPVAPSGRFGFLLGEIGPLKLGRVYDATPEISPDPLQRISVWGGS